MTEDLKREYWHLFQTFFRIGIFGFGGGPSMIPLVFREVVEKYHWLDDHEFSDILAVGNTLPGPIITKMSGYIGYRVAGVTGSLVALTAVILPAIIAMILLLTTLSAYKDEPWVNGLAAGVVPIVAVMMGRLTWDFFIKSKQTLGLAAALPFVAFGGVTLVWLKIHPAFVIGILLISALLRREPKQSQASGQNSAS